MGVADGEGSEQQGTTGFQLAPLHAGEVWAGEGRGRVPSLSPPTEADMHDTGYTRDWCIASRNRAK